MLPSGIIGGQADLEIVTCIFLTESRKQLEKFRERKKPKDFGR